MHPRQLTDSRKRQQGVALLMLVTLLVIAAAFALLERLNSRSIELAQASRTAAALGEAKTALIGYALSSQTRPGGLPCPDADNDGLSDPCDSAANTGRLPIKTLGLGLLEDAGGETLWYALDPGFDALGGVDINSDKPAALRVDGAATEIVAVILAPGPALPGQSRAGARRNDPASYLEGDNADADNNFSRIAGGDFNDRIITVSRDELMQSVERRVLKELAGLIAAYAATNGLPYAAPVGAPPADCTPGITQGLLPLGIAASCPPLPDWALPSWFAGDKWNGLVWYAMEDSCFNNPSCTGSIVIRNTQPPVTQARSILLAAGRALDTLGQTQPPPARNAITELLDSPVNNDGTDNLFEMLPLGASNNDQLLVAAP